MHSTIIHTIQFRKCEVAKTQTTAVHREFEREKLKRYYENFSRSPGAQATWG
jgi:hypothetical protein